MIERLFDDTYTGPRFTYGGWYRPMGYATVPEGWIIGSDRPHTEFPHGTLSWPRPLTAQEIASYQLEDLQREPCADCQKHKADVTPSESGDPICDDCRFEREYRAAV